MIKVVLRTPAIAWLAASFAWAPSAEAQAVVTPGHPGQTVIKERRLRRERNPYFAARPAYTQPNNGARANVTFEPFTRWYYPNQNSYYPPLNRYPSTRGR